MAVQNDVFFVRKVFIKNIALFKLTKDIPGVVLVVLDQAIFSTIF
jgi:hypothetical protein